MKVENGVLEKKMVKKKGLALIEILIASALVFFVILGMVALYSFDFNLFSANIKDSQLQNEANIAIGHITKQIRRKGKDANVGANNDYLQVHLGDDACGSSPCACQYKLVENELRYCDTYDPWCGASSLLVAENISQLEFRYDSTKKIVWMEIRLSEGDKSLTVEAQVRL